MEFRRTRCWGIRVRGSLVRRWAASCSTIRTCTTSTAPFRIDHDQAFQQTTHLQFQPKPNGPWYGMTWRYESGGVAGNAPFATDTTTPVSLTYPDGRSAAADPTDLRWCAGDAFGTSDELRAAVAVRHRW